MTNPSSSERFLELLTNYRRVAVVHHWDVDGISSSAILGRALFKLGVEAHYCVPKIGLYRPEAIDLEAVAKAKPRALLLVDYGLRVDYVDEVERRLGVDVVVVDHHANAVRAQRFYNPVARGAAEDDYPSTTWVLRELLKLDDDLDLVALGVVGDLGKSLEVKPIRRGLELMASKHGLSLEDLYEASNLVNSCYRLLDSHCIGEVRELLVERGVKGVLASCKLKEKAEELKREVERAAARIKEVFARGPVKAYELTSNSYITSSIGRELAYRHRESIVALVHKVESLGVTYIYVRSLKYNLRRALEELRAKGLEVGGKDQVFVVTCLNGRGEVDLVLEALTSIEVF
ncbi:MAG: hypothetical protein DRJ68_05305 [Thermoprotei archaeon]|nr:MAG: hypothetical protein DRJ68_05305 [Thermoprotei archaeon]